MTNLSVEQNLLLSQNTNLPYPFLELLGS